MPTVAERTIEQDYTIDEAATVLNVSRATMDNILRGGGVEYYRIGTGRGQKRISREALDQYRGRNFAPVDYPAIKSPQ